MPLHCFLSTAAILLAMLAGWWARGVCDDIDRAMKVSDDDGKRKRK